MNESIKPKMTIASASGASSGAAVPKPTKKSPANSSSDAIAGKTDPTGKKKTSGKASLSVSTSVPATPVTKESKTTVEKGGNVEVKQQVPLDALVVARILKSMGVTKYEPRVLNQLMEFIHRYVSEVLTDAREYSLYANKQVIDESDARLALQSRLSHNYSQLPSREILMELAERRNAIPLPPIPNEYGLLLPPPEHQLCSENIIIQSSQDKPHLKPRNGSYAPMDPSITPNAQNLNVNKPTKNPIKINISNKTPNTMPNATHSNLKRKMF